MQQAIVSQLGWRSLRPVQELSIPPLLAGHDAVVLAPTAGGKTESAMLPLLDRLLAEHKNGLPALIYLCPLKALINNLLPRLQSLAALAGRDAFAWHGEVTATQRKGFLNDPQAVLLTTPESLQVILSRPHLDGAALFGGLETVVIDEVHAFAGTARGDQLIALLHQLDHLRQAPLQRVGLSATVGNPHDLLHWLGGGRGRTETLVDPNRDGAQKSRRMLEVHPVGSDVAQCGALLARLMKGCAKSLLFVDSRRLAEEVRGHLTEHGVKALAHHSSLSQEIREQSEAVFKNRGGGGREPQTIVCTSTLELGLDVGDVDKVFQLGAPATVSAFLQRFGRAGRREGSLAHMVFVTDADESFLRALALIRLAINQKVEPVQPDRRAFCVLVQQILILILKDGALAADKLWAVLGTPPCFADITSQEKAELLEFMIAQGWLVKTQGRLQLGQRSETAFGRSHFMDLLSVFRSSAGVTVKTSDGRSVGTLDLSVALRFWSDRRSFILGGGSWLPKAWDPAGRILTVTGSMGGESVRWSGGKGESSKEILREVRALLTETDPLPFLGPKAQARLDQLRQEAAEVDAERPRVWETGRPENRKTVVELWAGERIHRTLATSWSGHLGCTTSSDERRIVVSAARARWEELMAGALRDPRAHLEAGLHAASGDGPAEELKFADLLPVPQRREVLWRHLYDVEGGAEVMTEFAG
jgi:ATP-dependent Lhr-like helicase